MVNGLSKVPYKVNVDTLEYLQKKKDLKKKFFWLVFYTSIRLYMKTFNT